MEQKKSSSNGSNRNQNNEDRYLGVAIHSQVIKIKQEMEKIGHLALQQSEIRLALREITQQQQKRQRQRSRSPLGLGERPISVGGS
ncbi:uncharacterized protein LOC127810364 [Diospyros lotus]|uniref:uncharacterized protein LOC127810364 n=1 Tax=Diospyros lotus TaxID=55363 RepID=UPI00224F3C04|nr:uncharacterized protein LOC127810364 [Diospyros lotus]